MSRRRPTAADREDARILAAHNEAMRETIVLSRQFTEVRLATHPTDVTP